MTGGNTTYFVYDEAGHLVGEYDGSGALIQETVWLGDTPVATLRPNGGSVAVYYVHTDHLNTPRRISRPSDNVIVWRWDSDPFGTTAANQDPDGDSTNFVYHLRFPGQYYDAETGLNYNFHRDFDSQTGRYVESDPIGLAGGVNTYAYVAGNPLSSLDPVGLCWSNARATFHFYFGGGRDVSIDQIGCRSQIDAVVSPERNIWKSRARSAAKARALSMSCDSTSRLSLSRSIGLQSGIFWLGGFSLNQQGDCLVGRACAATGTCSNDSYWYNCHLTSTMHDERGGLAFLNSKTHTVKWGSAI